ncbi:MAG: HupE/UreJ family protein [Bacteroidota bacterium]
MKRLSILLGLCILSLQLLLAHKPDQSYIFLRVFEDKIEGLFQITTDDLNTALDLNLQRGITEAELQPYLPQIQAYILAKTDFSSPQGKHNISFTDIKFLDLDLGYYVDFGFALDNVATIPDELDVRYEVIYDKKPKHRNHLVQQYNWKAGITNNESIISLTFKQGAGTDKLDLTTMSTWKGFVGMVESGMYHIYIGLDHILFLIALLLPAVVRRRKGNNGILTGWEAVDRFRPAFFYVLRIVTFFTIAHTITLSLAALQIVSLPSNFVEATIALSIALAAFHNIKPFYENETVAIAFIFGLFHGFGFASVLGEVGLKGEFMVLSLLGFNVGVELAQILIICAVFPILYFIRKQKFYIPAILIGGSVILIAIALYWFIERSFDINIGASRIVYYIIDGIKGIFS